ncbi:uncharacterized protein METZ01_LOCUS241748, partial [marine metagenome]
GQDRLHIRSPQLFRNSHRTGHCGGCHGDRTTAGDKDRRNQRSESCRLSPQGNDAKHL